MTLTFKNILFLAVALLALFSPLAAFASEDAHGGGSQLADLGWRVFNFIIFVAIIYFAAAKPIRSFLNGRIGGIKEELDDAEKGKDEAEKKLKDCLQKLEDLEDEIEEIHSTLRREGEVERDRIIEAAELAVEKIRTQAEHSAKQEQDVAIAAIKRETAEAAVALAEKILVESLDKGDQKRLVTEYVESLRAVN